ncbi:hypothetical protein SAMN05421788_106309 [Filimonas lacunae]|uniref:Uncharacterized protein n=2 Tax=Filimonas lacunae TaxID=477680 RepID=A0A173MF60_9BACT|nr:hypothetical protein FLA_2258 [Filimonas lacunae]SIT25425.1 hypothetical protein SAMN05421788_106309 [Filimonas lacunae]
MLATAITLYACQPSEASKQPEKKPEPVFATPPISETRQQVNSKAVATYTTKVKDELNDWHFTVEAFETAQTFTYKLKITYQEIHETDTITIPNFGIEPTVQLKKGPSQYSCIIGFLNKEKQFLPYKQVEAKGEKLKMTTLQHYSVATYVK